MKIPLLISLLLLGLYIFSTQANSTEHHPEEITQLFLETINSGNDEKTIKFIERYYEREFLGSHSMGEHLYFMHSVHQQHGELELKSLTSNEMASHIQYILKVRGQRTEQWGEFNLNISKEEPFKISGIFLTPSSNPEIADKPISMRKAKKELSAYVKRMAKKEVFSGAVLLAKGEKVIYTDAKGFSSRRFEITNNLQTKFNLASMNKMFTAIAIMQLVERGKLSLNDTLDKFADETWLAKEVSNKIQIQHLLTHTSGLGSYINQRFMESSKGLFRAVDDYKPLIKDETLQFEPGSRFGYSNTGMFMLGVVIEKVSGQDYFTYIQENIYKPAGMINSDSYEMDRPVPNLAIGYMQAPDTNTGWKNNLYLHVLKGGPAGGGFSTVEDLHRFALALTEYKLLSKELTEQLYSPKPELGVKNYGYGFRIDGEEGNRIVGHSGGFGGLNSNLDIYLDRGYIAVVLSNYSHGAQPIEEKIRELLRVVEG